MIAPDTNLLVRLLLRDDAAQHARVEALMTFDKAFVRKAAKLGATPQVVAA